MKRILSLILVLILPLTLSACSRHDSDVSYRSNPPSEQEISETSEITDQPTDSSEGSNTTKPNSSGTSGTQNPAAPTSTSSVKYTDGNSYVLTDDRHFIIRVNPKVSGYEIMYEGKFTEILYQPVYRNCALFFSRETKNEPEKIYRLDVSTKKITTVFSADKIADFSEWSIVADKLFLTSHKSGGYITYWMCNLDGSNLKKTSAVDVTYLSRFSNEYNGKIYMVTSNMSSNSVTFCEMNLDGTGFKKLFTKSHHLCGSYELLGVVNGNFYYTALTTHDESTGDGLYKVKMDGSGQKRIQRATMGGADTDGTTLFLCPNDIVSGISRIEKNDTISHNIALKGAVPSFLINLHNGYLFAEGDRVNYLLSVPDLKAYKIADYSPPSPFAKYKRGLNILSLPKKTTYKVGEGFDATGFDHLVYGSATGLLMPEPDKITYTTSDGVTLTQGRPFTTVGKKEIQIRYNGSVATTYTITVTADSNNLKSGLNLLAYPTKTTYKVGEGFDTTGLNAVYYADGQSTNVNDKLTFYTSNTVELTQGRPFTTAGTKVVEIRYNGKKVSSYTINVAN